MKVLVATEKPFAAVAVDSIRKVIEDAGYELELLEKYPSREELLAAVADADALIAQRQGRCRSNSRRKKAQSDCARRRRL